jgi:hypothetical protein
MPNKRFLEELQKQLNVINTGFSFDEWKQHRSDYKEWIVSQKAQRRTLLDNQSAFYGTMTEEWRKEYRRLSYIATQRVHRAVIKGLLPNLRQVAIVCVDCKMERATRYDHRDYNRPLEVAPVCNSCNKKRGPAKI